MVIRLTVIKVLKKRSLRRTHLVTMCHPSLEGICPGYATLKSRGQPHLASWPEVNPLPGGVAEGRVGQYVTINRNPNTLEISAASVETAV